MSGIEFGSQSEEHEARGINLARSAEPDFNMANDELYTAWNISNEVHDVLVASIFEARIINELGAVSVRQGLYKRNDARATDQEVFRHVETGITCINTSYVSLLDILSSKESRLRARKLEPGVHSHICNTMNTWLKAVQALQLLTGDIGPDKKADQAAVNAQWMLGRGRPKKLGAWVHGQQGDNGYWTTQTAFLGMRAERVNGGAVHVLKGLKWGMLRGLPELSRELIADPAHRKQIILEAGHLTLESMTRRGAMIAALDHRRF